MVEGDESSRLKMANYPAVWANYQPLLTALYSKNYAQSWYKLVSQTESNGPQQT